MSKQTQFHVFIDNAAVVVAGPIAITFPTTLIAKTQGTNASVALGVGDTIVLAANAARKFAQIVNVSGTLQFIAFGAVGSALTIPLPNNGVYTLEPDTIGEINQQAVHVFSIAGGVSVQVYEE